MRYSTDFNPKNILCPIDFSDLSSLALKYAAAGARLYEAKLIILHAGMFELPRYFSRSETERLAQEIVKTKEMMQEDLAAHFIKVLGKGAEDLNAVFEVIELNPVDAILQTAGKRSIGLIVIGTHGLTGVKRLLLGSVAEHVISSAGRPVFTVRQKVHDFIDVANQEVSPHIKHILCACDIKESDRPVLKYAASIADSFHAELTVLFSDESQEPEDLSGSRETLSRWISETINTQYNLKPVICKGGAADQIITHAKEEKSDLIVAGAHHRKFHGSMILGRTTDLVVRHAPAPVLVIPDLNE